MTDRLFYQIFCLILFASKNLYDIPLVHEAFFSMLIELNESQPGFAIDYLKLKFAATIHSPHTAETRTWH